MKVVNSQGGVYDEIIKYYVSKYGLNSWTLDFTNITPQKAYDELGEYVQYDHTGETLMLGATFAKKKRIMLFWGGINSYARKTFNLAHELAHAVHYDIIPSSTSWDGKKQERFADNLAQNILDELGV